MPRKLGLNIEELQRGVGAPEVALQRIIQSGDSMGFSSYCGFECGPFCR